MKKRTVRQALKDAKAVEAWFKQQAELRAVEDQIVGERPRSYSLRTVWKVDPPLPEEHLLAGADFSQGRDQTVIITGSLGADGVYTFTPAEVGTYLVTMEFEE